VFVIDKNKNPLMPCHPARAREMLRKGRAVVVRLYPFTIRIKDRIGGAVQPVSLKLDPGSKTTGVAVAREDEDRTEALWLGEITHRGAQIRKSLEQRSGYRRRRRSANLRHRAPRFDNRSTPEGRLMPSLRHRVDNVMSWTRRLMRWCPVTRIAMELVRFDMQAMQNPEISGVEYQRGTLFGYEVREYLLEKWGRKCAYCGAEGVPLQVEHIQPKARGGSDRVSNLALACRPCNEKKGSRPVEEFLKGKPGVLRHVLAQTKTPLKDAAAVNTTRWALWRALTATGLPVETGSGGLTKYNRCRLGVPKTHALDALCVGEVVAVSGWQMPTLAIKATGRGAYQRTRVIASGFPRGYLMRKKAAFGFRTGDMVVASVPTGKKAGVHRGRVAIRETGSFNIQTSTGVVQGIRHKRCRLQMRADGYGYSQTKQETALLPALKDGVSAPEIR
jgi:5-methylcytosine-specific restriction endonuclease McrA